MKKLSLFLLCSISCVYHLQSMEVALQQPDSLDEQLCHNNSVNNTAPKFKQTTSFDQFSVKLYNQNLTPYEITNLVRQGANVNYKCNQCLAIPLHFALNTNEHAIENMKTIIDHGAELHNILKGESETPLSLAVKCNNSPMIELLLPYEKNKESTSQERQKRVNFIYKLLSHQNFESIKLFLSLELLTANEIFSTFTQCKKPDKEFLQYLINNGATNYHNALNNAINDAFPIPNNNHIQMVSDLAGCGAYNAQALKKISDLEKTLTTIRKQLEKNKPSGSSEK